MVELLKTRLYSDANLQFYMRMEGNSNDEKGSHNGTDTNVTYSTADGKYGQGAQFNGVDSKIVTTFNPNYTDGTIAFWFKAVAGGGYFFGNNDAGSHTIRCLLGGGTGVLGFNYSNDGSNFYGSNAPGRWDDGIKHHVAFSWGALGWKLWMEGILVANNAGETTPATNLSTGIYLGGLNNNGGLNGAQACSLDDFAAFNRQLSNSEVKLLALPPTTGFFGLL